MTSCLTMPRQVEMLQRLYPDGLPAGVELRRRDVAALTNGTVEVVYVAGGYDVWAPGDDMFERLAMLSANVAPDDARATLEGRAA